VRAPLRVPVVAPLRVRETVSGMPTCGGRGASVRRRRGLAVMDAEPKVIKAPAFLGLRGSPYTGQSPLGAIGTPGAWSIHAKRSVSGRDHMARVLDLAVVGALGGFYEVLVDEPSRESSHLERR
jgi:hypothetical protein